MKRIVAKIGVLIGVFLVSLVAFAIILNQKNINIIADAGHPNLPTISFKIEGQSMNTLVGYKTEMEVPSMRNTVVPLDDSGKLELDINPYGETIKGIEYEVLTLDGSNVIKKGEIETGEEIQTIDLKNEVAIGMEQVLKITLRLEEDEQVHYYTRLTKIEEDNNDILFKFVADFHASAIGKNGSEIKNNLESNSEGDNSTLQKVTINSNVNQVTWGELEPVINGDVEWSIKEANNVFTSIELKYQVMCVNEDDSKGEDFYDVTEFFKVRYDIDRESTYLLQYNREMVEVQEADDFVITEGGIDLGISSDDVSIMKSDNEKVLAFVQERELWSYHVEDEVLHEVFAFDHGNHNDVRNKNDNHDIRIMSVTNEGDITFSLYGYMNRGEHEGRVGTVIYYYDAAEKILQEKVFVEENQSFATIQKELRNAFYYNAKDELLYVLAQEALYEVDVTEKSQEKLSADTDAFQYKISTDGEKIIYINEKNGVGEEFVYMNFTTGEELVVKAKEGEAIQALGFIGDDFVYGLQKESAEAEPLLYQLVIGNEKDESHTEFQKDGQFIEDVTIEENRVAMEMVVSEGGGYRFIGQEFLTNNKEDVVEDLESYVTEFKQTQYRILVDGIEKDAKVTNVEPIVIFNEDALEISFESMQKNKYHVFAYGKIIDTFENAGDAILLAKENEGAVINQNQAYIWQSGNRDLSYEITNGEELKQRILAGTTILEVVEGSGAGETIDYSGCGVEEMLYVVNQERPVAVNLTDGQWILLIGYNSSDKVTYFDQSGNRENVSIEELNNSVKDLIGEGNI